MGRGGRTQQSSSKTEISNIRTREPMAVVRRIVARIFLPALRAPRTLKDRCPARAADAFHRAFIPPPPPPPQHSYVATSVLVRCGVSSTTRRPSSPLLFFFLRRVLPFFFCFSFSLSSFFFFANRSVLRQGGVVSCGCGRTCEASNQFVI